jgi:hypothetical protein
MAKITMTGGGAGGGISGAGANGEIAFFTASDTIDSESLLRYNSTSDVMTVGSATDGSARLTVQGFGAGSSATGKGLSLKNDNGLEVFYIGDHGRMYINAQSSTEGNTGGVFIGNLAGNTITQGENNVGVGSEAGRRVTTGNRNVFLGLSSGAGTTTGSDNIFIGSQAGEFIQTGAPGDRNTAPLTCIYIGTGTKALNEIDENAITIGNDAMSAGSNTVVLGNIYITETFLYGNVNLQDGKNLIFSGAGTKIGTATSQKLAFWNKTPIVQPTTAISGAAIVHGTGTTIKADDTFGGYTLAQIAQALINIGILQ